MGTEILSLYPPHTHTHEDPHGDPHTHGRSENLAKIGPVHVEINGLTEIDKKYFKN